mgnify:FL=1
MTNLELIEYAKLLRLPNFRGVFMRDELQSMIPRKGESGILNLDLTTGHGTHWVAYKKRGKRVIYFDSFGLRPPPEVIRYFKGSQMVYSNDKLQTYDSSACGKLCLQFLIKEATK